MDTKTYFDTCKFEYLTRISPNSETYRKDPVENNSCTLLILESPYLGVIWGIVYSFIMTTFSFSLRH